MISDLYSAPKNSSYRVCVCSVSYVNSSRPTQFCPFYGSQNFGCHKNPNCIQCKNTVNYSYNISSIKFIYWWGLFWTASVEGRHVIKSVIDYCTHHRHLDKPNQPSILECDRQLRDRSMAAAQCCPCHSTHGRAPHRRIHRPVSQPVSQQLVTMVLQTSRRWETQTVGRILLAQHTSCILWCLLGWVLTKCQTQP